MIKLKTLLKQVNEVSSDDYRKDWMERHQAKLDEKGRLIAYHGTPKKNLTSIKINGFKPHSYFTLKKDYAERIAATYHKGKIIVIEVRLPLDAIEFVMSDIYSTRIIDWNEVI